MGTGVVRLSEKRARSPRFRYWFVVGAAALFCMAGALRLGSEVGGSMFLLTEAGYGDSYILHDVLAFQKTGVIYRDLSHPPYEPTQYGPMVYVLYAAAARPTQSGNPFVAPRLMALALFLLCVCTICSIVHAVVRGRNSWLWGAGLAATIASMGEWVLQLRGDFAGMLLSLLAIRLLMVRRWWTPVLAGLCGGFATQFKFTYISALVAGACWLALRREWKNLLWFCLGGALTSVGLYTVFGLHEPRMLAQILAIRPPIVDPAGCMKLVWQALREPVVTFAVLGFCLPSFRPHSRWSLLLLFTVTSFTIATATDLQAGGNINYFFESLVATIPAAVLGLLRVIAWASRRIPSAGFVAALMLLQFLAPIAEGAYHLGRTEVSRETKNEEFQHAATAFRGRKMLSAVPRFAILDADPVLIEPFLLSYLHRNGKFNPEPLLNWVRAKTFEVVIMPRQISSWRGVPTLDPALKRAVEGSYKPQCALLRCCIVYTPKDQPDDQRLTAALRESGCSAVE